MQRDETGQVPTHQPLDPESFDARLEHISSLLEGDEELIEDGEGGEGGDEPGPTDSQEEPTDPPSDEDENQPEETTEEEVEDGDEPSPEDDVYEVTINGEKHEVTETELLQAYEFRGMMTQRRQRDAESHRQAMTAVSNKEQELDHKLGLLDNALKENTPDTFDFDAIKDLPQEQQRAAIEEWTNRKKMRDSIEEERKQIEGAQRLAQARQAQAVAQQEGAALLQAVPEWNDEGVMETEMNGIGSFAAQQLGFGPKELEVIAQDHRSILALRYAKRGFEAEKGISNIKKNVKKVTRTKPGQVDRKNPNPATDSKQLERLKARMKSGDPSARVEYFEKTRPNFFE